MNLFTYGTLMRGECRNEIMDYAEFQGTAYVYGQLYNYQRGGFPVLFNANNKGAGDKVFGEVYRIPDELLEEYITLLDRIEGTASGLYQKRGVTVTMEHDTDKTMHCFYYEGAGVWINEGTGKPHNSLIRITGRWNS